MLLQPGGADICGKHQRYHQRNRRPVKLLSKRACGDGAGLTVSAMIGSTLKGNETVTVKVEGNGPIGLIMVDANPKGEVRAYVQNPHCHFDNPETHKLDVKSTVGDRGFISVIKDLKLKEPFIGTVPIISGEIAEDFAYYFNVSEQILSAVALGVLVDEDSRAVWGYGTLGLPRKWSPDPGKIKALLRFQNF